MAFADRYINNNLYQNLDFKRAPSGLLRYIIAIPAFAEPDIFITLQSIKKCKPGKFAAEVLILVNFPETIAWDIKKNNIDLFHSVSEWCQKNSNEELLFFCFISDNLPRKYAGPGLARKILMDLAVKRFNSIDLPDGLIVSLDADTMVPTDYFEQIEHSLEKHPKAGCLIFNFAHADSGNEYMSKVYRSAILYEMYLRYLKLMLKRTGFPHYHHTIGSCFAVKAFVYSQVGGMNKRKGGEDFYFLHKVFPVTETNYLKDLILIPSVRPSWRVPFGTGPAIRQMAAQPEIKYLTYNPESFRDIEKLINLLPEIYSGHGNHLTDIINQLPKSLNTFIHDNKGVAKITDIKNNCASKQAFTKRFFLWFDAFMIIKYLNYVKDRIYKSTSVVKAVKLTAFAHEPDIDECSETELLLKLRLLDFNS